jgi:hypothetical protein
VSRIGAQKRKERREAEELRAALIQILRDYDMMQASGEAGESAIERVRSLVAPVVKTLEPAPEAPASPEAPKATAPEPPKAPTSLEDALADYLDHGDTSLLPLIP